MLITSHRKPATPILCCPLSINRIYVSPAFLSNNINRHHLAAIYLEAVYCLWKVNFYSQNWGSKSQVFSELPTIIIVATILFFPVYLHLPPPSLLFHSSADSAKPSWSIFRKAADISCRLPWQFTSFTVLPALVHTAAYHSWRQSERKLFFHHDSCTWPAEKHSTKAGRYRENVSNFIDMQERDVPLDNLA